MEFDIWNLLNYVWFYLLALAYVAIFVNEITMHTTRLNKHINIIVTTTGLVAFTIFNLCLLTDTLVSLWQTPVSATILLSAVTINTIVKMLLNANNCRHGIRRIICSLLLIAIILSCVLRPFGL